MPSNSRILLQEYLANMSIHSGAVADVGGGDKRVVKSLAKCEYNKYVVFDIDEKHTPDVVMDLNERFEDEQYHELFDYVFCLETFEYIEDMRTAARNLLYLTKPGGRLIASWVFMYPHHGKEDTSRWTDTGIVRIFENAGFHDIRIVERNSKDKEVTKWFYNNEGFHSPELRDKNYNFPIAFILEATK